jgi:hypothetical protein
VIDSALDGSPYWETMWSDDDNDSRFWPHDDLQILEEDKVEMTEEAE